MAVGSSRGARLRRMTDLFVEGTTLVLGEDADGLSLAWISKLNSFQVDEARRDGTAARGQRMHELRKADNPEARGVRASLEDWELDRIASSFAEFGAEERYLQAVDDVRTSEKWNQTAEDDARLVALLDDEGAPPDDQRRLDVAQRQIDYLTEIREAQIELQEEAENEAKAKGIDQLRKDYLELWGDRMSINEFIQAQKVTQIYYAFRECDGTLLEGQLDAFGQQAFDHASCDHARRALADRGEVFGLPEGLLDKIADTLDLISMPSRQAGNSDAPRPSSVPSEQPSSEEASQPSIPEEMPSVPATT